MSNLSICNTCTFCRKAKVSKEDELEGWHGCYAETDGICKGTVLDHSGWIYTAALPFETIQSDNCHMIQGSICKNVERCINYSPKTI